MENLNKAQSLEAHDQAQRKRFQELSDKGLKIEEINKQIADETRGRYLDIILHPSNDLLH